MNGPALSRGQSHPALAVTQSERAVGIPRSVIMDLDNTLARRVKPTALSPVANTDTKRLIYASISKRPSFGTGGMADALRFLDVDGTRIRHVQGRAAGLVDHWAPSPDPERLQASSILRRTVAIGRWYTIGVVKELVDRAFVWAKGLGSDTGMTVAAAYIGVVGWSARRLPLPLELRFSKAMPRPVSLSGFSSARALGSLVGKQGGLGRLHADRGLRRQLFAESSPRKPSDPTASEPIGVTVGDAYQALPLSAELERHEIFFEGIGASRSVHFTVPHPISPRRAPGRRRFAFTGPGHRLDGDRPAPRR